MKKVIIVGGGFAGYLTALFLNKNFPKLKIDIIKSSDKEQISAGEQTGKEQLQLFFESLGIEETEWFSRTKSFLKIGNSFVGWGNRENFDPRVGGPDVVNHSFVMENKLLPLLRNGGGMKSVKDSMKYNDKLHTELYQNSFLETPIDNTDDYIDSFKKHFKNSFFNRKNNRAIAHMHDWLEIGKFIETKFDDNVKIITDHITDVVVDKKNNTIEYLVNKDKEKIKADHYVDCTGISRILISKLSKVVDISDEYPVNSAVFGPVEYIDRTKEMVPTLYTTAFKNGYSFKTPLQHRIGTGYVYSDKYISKDEAIDEINDYWDGRFKSDQVNHLKWTPSYVVKPFQKNCSAVGLAGQFDCPMESTVFTQISTALQQLGNYLNRDNKLLYMNRSDIRDEDMLNYCNTWTEYTFHNTRHFKQMMFYTTNRDDSEFWKNIKTLNYSDIFYKKLSFFLDNSFDYIIENRNKFPDYTPPTNFNINEDRFWRVYQKGFKGYFDYMGIRGVGHSMILDVHNWLMILAYKKYI